MFSRLAITSASIAVRHFVRAIARIAVISVFNDRRSRVGVVRAEHRRK